MTTRPWLQLLVAALLFSGCIPSAQANEKEKPSEAMSLILAHHQPGPHDLDPKGLPLDAAMRYPTPEDEAQYEIYAVPYPKGTADYFCYHVYLHTKTGRYWILITGGFAGVNRFLGPGTIGALKP